jgi:hypothetical protein
MKYKAKPYEIEAFRFGYDKEPSWFWDKVQYNDIYYINDESCQLETNTGCEIANKGDYICTSPDNPLFKMNYDRFHLYFERADLKIVKKDS